MTEHFSACINATHTWLNKSKFIGKIKPHLLIQTPRWFKLSILAEFIRLQKLEAPFSCWHKSQASSHPNKKL